MSLSRFKVTGRFDGATSATVEIDRETGLVHVRPNRSRRVYTMRLCDVAEMVQHRVVRHEVADKQRCGTAVR